MRAAWNEPGRSPNEWIRPWRSSILLVAGDKAGQWSAWYREAIPLAEVRYDAYLKERER